MEDSAPLPELPAASLIVQSSRFSPTGCKLASHCHREACLTGKSPESCHAVRRSIGDVRETDGNAVVAADLDVRVVLLECLIEVPADLETILFEAKKGAMRVRSQLGEALSLRRTLF